MEVTTEQLKIIIKDAVKEATTEDPKVTLTIAECASLTGIGRDKLMELAHSQKSDFPCFKVGSKFLINRPMVIEWLEKISKERRVL